MTFVNNVLSNGGRISPLIISDTSYNGTGLFNPSIFSDGSNIFVNIRHCQYTIYHAEKGKFEHPYGPLVYLNPESDRTLTTRNYFGKLDPITLNTVDCRQVDTKKLDVKPLWEFVGLEDARIIKWDGKLFLTGVRRDTTTNGQGRMELSEIVFDGGVFKEVSRYRIPAPYPDTSYCEKNWMPIVDMPYHYVKWTNPTEIVSVDPKRNTCTTIHLGTSVPREWDYRGGSQVITFGDYHIACTHTTFLFKSELGRKNARYRHSFVVWDKHWNLIKTTDLFSFLDFEIEFCCGMTVHGDKVYMTFGVQDNAAFVLEIPTETIRKFIFNHA